MKINVAAVVGAGTMGNGIAHVFALANIEVVLIDIQQEALEKALSTIDANMDRMVKKEIISHAQKEDAMARICTQRVIKHLEEVDLAVEAVSENPALKHEIFDALDKALPQHAILATNTSSISITQIAAQTTRPERVIGMHFMNPVPIMPLVEIINGYNTSKEVTHTIESLTRTLNKTPIIVGDYPGFVSNRILMPMINEAIYTLHEGVAGVLEIDGVMKLGMAHPMGPLLLADFIGLDVCLQIMNVLYEGFKQSKYAPCPLLVNMVAAGKTGAKSGEGFYVHLRGSKEKKVAPKFL